MKLVALIPFLILSFECLSSVTAHVTDFVRFEPLLNDMFAALARQHRMSNGEHEFTVSSDAAILGTILLKDEAVAVSGRDTPKLFPVPTHKTPSLFDLSNTTLHLTNVELIAQDNGEISRIGERSRLLLDAVLLGGDLVNNAPFALTDGALDLSQIGISSTSIRSLVQKDYSQGRVIIKNSIFSDFTHHAECPLVFADYTEVSRMTVTNITTSGDKPINPNKLLKQTHFYESCLIGNVFDSTENVFYGGMVLGVNSHKFVSTNNTYHRSTSTHQYFSVSWLRNAFYSDDEFTGIGTWQPNLPALTVVNASCTIENCYFHRCCSLILGGGVLVTAPLNTLTIKGTNFTDLNCSLCGAGICAVVAQFNIEGCSISKTNVQPLRDISFSAGAVLVSLMRESMIKETTFSQCNADYAAAASILTLNKLEINQCGFEDNTASQYCAGLLVMNIPLMSYVNKFLGVIQDPTTITSFLKGELTLSDIVTEVVDSTGSLTLKYCWFKDNTVVRTQADASNDGASDTGMDGTHGADLFVTPNAGLLSPPVLDKCFSNQKASVYIEGEDVDGALAYSTNPKADAEDAVPKDSEDLVTIILGVAAVVVVVVLLGLCCYCCCCRKKKENQISRYELQTTDGNSA